MKPSEVFKEYCKNKSGFKGMECPAERGRDKELTCFSCMDKWYDEKTTLNDGGE